MSVMTEVPIYMLQPWPFYIPAHWLSPWKQQKQSLKLNLVRGRSFPPELSQEDTPALSSSCHHRDLPLLHFFAIHGPFLSKKCPIFPRMAVLPFLGHTHILPRCQCFALRMLMTAQAKGTVGPVLTHAPRLWMLCVFKHHEVSETVSAEHLKNK